MGEGKRGKPRSELERLEIFEQLAGEYFRMAALFPPAGTAGADTTAVDDEQRRWVDLFRAALLRKFIVRDEHVSLKLVVRALRRCNVSADRQLDESADDIERLFTAEMVQGRQHAASEPVAAGPDRFEDVLYGRLLHGDADRFHRSGWAGDRSRLEAALAGRFEAERALSRALEVVRYGFARGLLRPPG